MNGRGKRVITAPKQDDFLYETDSPAATGPAAAASQPSRPVKKARKEPVFESASASQPVQAAAAASSSAAAFPSIQEGDDSDSESDDDMIAAMVADIDGLSQTQTPAQRAADEAASLPPIDDVPPPLEEAQLPDDEWMNGQPDRAEEKQQNVDPFGEYTPSALTFVSWSALRQFMANYAAEKGFLLVRRTNGNSTAAELAATKSKAATSTSTPAAASSAPASSQPATQLLSQMPTQAAPAINDPSSMDLDGDGEKFVDSPEPEEKQPKNGTFYCKQRLEPKDGEVIETGERPRGHVAQQKQIQERAGCKFAVNFSYQKKSGLYHINKRYLEHTHILLRPSGSAGAPLSITSLRQITEGMATQVETWLGMGVPGSTIQRLLAAEYRLSAIDPVVFKNLLQRTRVKLGFGHSHEQVQALIHWMKQRSLDGDAFFDVGCDEDLRTDSIFFMTHSMRRQFIRNGQFLVLDATCNTNRFNMQLAVLVGIDENFNSVILAFALLKTESSNSYLWMLGHVKRIVGDAAWNRVQTVATDGAPAFYQVLHRLLPDAFHMRCRWHISMNIHRHLGSKLGAKFRSFMRAFKDVARQPTTRKFDSAWMSLLQDYPGAGDASISQSIAHKNRLLKQYKLPSVSIHGPLKDRIHSELTTFAAHFILREREFFTNYTPNLASLVETKQGGKTVKASMTMIAVGSTAATGGKKAIGAMTNDEKMDREVTVSLTEMKCSCGGPARFLLPCRHVLSANFKAFGDLWQPDQVHRRWTKSFQPPVESAVINQLGSMTASGQSQETDSTTAMQPLERTNYRMSAASRYHDLVARCQVICSLVRNRPAAHDLFVGLLRKLELHLNDSKRQDVHSRATAALIANDVPFINGIGRPMESITDPLSQTQIGASVVNRYESVPSAQSSNARRGVTVPGHLPIEITEEHLFAHFGASFINDLAAMDAANASTPAAAAAHAASHADAGAAAAASL